MTITFAQSNHHKKHRAKKIQERCKNGLCFDCKKPIAPTSTRFCEECLEKKRVSVYNYKYRCKI